MKKSILSLTIFLFLSVLLKAQTTTLDFEAWTSNNPDGWVTTNFSLLGINITQSTTFHTGQYAVKLEVIESSQGEIYPPAMTATNVPISEQYGSLNGYYQFTQMNPEDYIGIGATLYNESSVIGGGAIELHSSASSYSFFQIPLEYLNTETPTRAYISVVISSDADDPTIGTFGLLDDLSFGGAVGIKELTSSLPFEYNIEQNFPNPFNPSTTIEYSIPQESFVELKVYDIIGNEVAFLVNETKPAGIYNINFNAADLPSGIYIARFNAGSFTKTFKMTLLK